MIYRCGYCEYIGPCYGTPILGGRKSGVSAPWCKRCGKNDKLKIYVQSIPQNAEKTVNND